MYPFLLLNGHSFIQLILSLMIQVQHVFGVFLPHAHQGRLPYVPAGYRSHIKELYNLEQWFNAHPLHCVRPTIGSC